MRSIEPLPSPWIEKQMPKMSTEFGFFNVNIFSFPWKEKFQENDNSQLSSLEFWNSRKNQLFPHQFPVKDFTSSFCCDVRGDRCFYWLVVLLLLVRSWRDERYFFLFFHCIQIFGKRYLYFRSTGNIFSFWVWPAEVRFCDDLWDFDFRAIRDLVSKLVLMSHH